MESDCRLLVGARVLPAAVVELVKRPNLGVGVGGRQKEVAGLV